jgi:hypothetical protein
VSTLGANRYRNAKKTLLALAARAASRSRIYSLWRPFPKASRFLNGARAISLKHRVETASRRLRQWHKPSLGEGKMRGLAGGKPAPAQAIRRPAQDRTGPARARTHEKHAELARVRERLLAPDVSPAPARQLRKHVTALEREIAELEENG